jgi:replicative DNA helicase
MSESQAKRQLPQNSDAEASLLGAVLIDNDALTKIADKITSDDFFEAKHRHTYEAVQQLYDNHRPIDVLTLSNQLNANGFLESVGGAPYLTELTNYVPTAAHVEDYAGIVAQKSLRRKLIAAAEEISGLSYDESQELHDLIEVAETKLFDVSHQHISQNVVSLENILAESFDRLDELHKDKAKVRGLPTGFKDLDNTLAGLQKADLFILAARPSMGKAQPEDAPVLTPTGWTTMGNVKTGDAVASLDGQPSTVTGVFPQGTKQIYKISFSDGRTAEATDEHLWRIHFRGWEVPRILTTAELQQKLTRKRYQKRLWIDMCSGDFGHHETLPIPPWTLGLLIGEGDFQSLRFSTASKEVVDRIALELGREFTIHAAGRYDYRIVQAAGHQRPGKYGVWPNPLKEQLKQLGLWGKLAHGKYIPQLYKAAERPARLALLQGLLDADGWVERHGSLRFATSSEQLADDVTDLARSLGTWAKKTTKATTYTYHNNRKNGRPSFVITIVHKHAADFVTLPDKRSRAAVPKKRLRRPTLLAIEPSRQAESRCIKVSHPSELYLTQDYVVTHNTALAMALAHNASTLDGGAPVLIFSLEMSKEQLTDRLLSMESGVDAWALRTGNLSDDDFERIGEAMGTLSEAKMFIDDTPGITVADLRTRARREAHKQPLGLIIIDYLQLMSGGAKFGNDFNRVQEISTISRGLKSVARELNVPVIALSQLSRSVESRSPQIPQLSDLRESGSIEQDADVVAFLYREDYYNQDTDRQNIIDVLIKKHRNGPTKNLELYFDRTKQQFRDLDTRHETPFDN